MGIPTNFGAFKARGMKAITDIRTAVKERDWKWLFPFFVYVFVALVVVGVVTFSSLINSLEAFGVIKENIYAPQRDLKYERVSEEKNDDNTYTSVFRLTLSAPEGKTGGMFLYSYPKGCDQKNAQLISNPGITFKNYTTYAVSEYQITCKTDKPLTEENSLLFELRK